MSAEKTFEYAVTHGAETIAGFTVYGIKGLVGKTWVRSIIQIDALKKGGVALTALVRALEAEALAAGATEIRLVGHAIINKTLKDPAFVTRL